MPQTADQLIISKVLAGDSSAFAHLIELHKLHVFNICLKIIGHHQEAEEVAQDVFMKVYQKLDSFRQESKFSTWLYRIAYNLSISHQRRNNNRFLEWEMVEGVQVYDDTKVEEEPLNELHQHQENLAVAISKLSGQAQILLQLYYEEDLPVSEVAEITNLSEANVKVKLYRSRKRLYELLQESSSTNANTG